MTVKNLREAIEAYPLDCEIVVEYEEHPKRLIMMLDLIEHKAFTYGETMKGDYRTHEGVKRIYVNARPV